MTSEPPSKPRKKCRLFEAYIPRVVKQVGINRPKLGGIAAGARQQINTLLCCLAETVSAQALRLATQQGRKTITEKEVAVSLQLVLPKELAKHSVSEGNAALETYEKRNTGTSRQTRAGIIFPPSLLEKFLRDFGNSRALLSAHSPVFLAAALEYVTWDLLCIAADRCILQKRARITVRDLDFCVKDDEQYHSLVNRLHFAFISGTSDTDCLFISRAAFARLVKSVCSSENIKIRGDSLLLLQHFVEQTLIDTLAKANSVAGHSGRVKLTSADLNLVLGIQNEWGMLRGPEAVESI